MARGPSFTPVRSRAGDCNPRSSPVIEVNWLASGRAWLDWRLVRASSRHLQETSTMSETSSTTTASQGGSSSGPLPSGAEVLSAWLKHAAYVRVDGRKYLVLESVPFDDLLQLQRFSRQRPLISSHAHSPTPSLAPAPLRSPA